MSIRVAITHETNYFYDRLVTLSPHILRLRPAVHTRTPIEAYSLKIKPEKHFINWQQDPFGNFLARIMFPEKTNLLSFNVEVIANMTVINPFDFFVEDYAEHYPFEYDKSLYKELMPYFEIKEQGPLLKDWLSKIDLSKKIIVDFLVDLNQQLRKDIGYTIRFEPGIQSCEETLGKAIGSCRDTGWLLVQILRHLGLAARFVSGYLIQLTADVKSLDGPSGPEQDFTDLHAWAEVYVPGAGWLGLDPTSGLFAGEGHIPLACTPEPQSAAPVTGYTDKCEVEFTYKNIVRRIYETPRVTKPYTEEDWALIYALGKHVDEQLDKGDVRLTMGGEPTFVSIDDMESPEWNMQADSPNKQKLANSLVKRLFKAFAHGGMLHYGQGKWYPGEPLPRWRFSCFWRKDGASLWQNPELLADTTRDYGFGLENAELFIHNLANRLDVDPCYVAPGFEDTFYYLWKEGNLPINVDPLKYDLKDPGDRRTLARLLDRGLNKPTGYVLPIKWNNKDQTWRSSYWKFKLNRMYLIPGDSPMGLRLPLESLPWIAPEKRQPHVEQSLFQPLPELGDFYGEVARRFSKIIPQQGPCPEIQEQESADIEERERHSDVPHTAICVEPRDGRIYVFLPPVTHLEHFLDLAASIESTAQALNMPVVLEGYEPPQDFRIQRLLVTPDPGVIEVNIQPAKDWDELVHNTITLYEEARMARLCTEKFMLDGRHTGTGGGNHLTIGGPTPTDSPILRKPHLLQSLITFWQHHPGLSYMFSGLFIGPTSQAPRVDEARDESIYELEIAFEQMPDDYSPKLWLVDRLLRHLLVDLTGNTHRAEFCIDKLYSPDSPTGRLGLVELRAFEMPPHARMSLVQMLMLRTLIAWFWKKPYRHKLVRWGTELHDKFMLPHYTMADLKDVINSVQAAGFPFQEKWLDPFFEFRFPFYGKVNIQDIELELRMAIEPWHVLGEEITRAGTARFVDSSVERLQIKVTGLTDSRYVVVCNDRRVPLHSTGTHGEYVAGVRYRAWQPPSALHPTIGVHSPLVFDVIDTWNGRSIGGCTYHVAHPGGRHYEDFPVNAYVAETRRITRFWNYGHTQGPIQPPPDTASFGKFFPKGSPPGMMEPPQEEVNKEYPYTLDLRKK